MVNRYPWLNSQHASEEEDPSIFLSIGDMMSGLLMIFALLFSVVLVKITEMSEPKRILIGTVLEAIQGNEIDVVVNPETGDISIRDSILFDRNSAELKPEGKAFLRDFIPVYSGVIFSDPMFDEEITQVIIEGHTSSKGSYEANMRLSLLRSLSVSNYIFSEEFNFPTSEQFSQKIMTAGRGEIDADPNQDRAADRRVTFRFQFRGDEIEVLYDELPKAE